MTENMTENRFDRKLLIYPVLFAAVLAPVFIVALITYRPNADCDDCDCAALPALATHSHGFGIETEVVDDMQLIFNVTPGTQLYQVVDGQLELCSGSEGDVAGELKHVTLDVYDARFVLGERLPVDVSLAISRADSGEVVVRASAPAMYAPGHGYHFGDNYIVPNDATYEWTVSVSPVQALRQDGAQNLWLEPVEWSGTFHLDAEGRVTTRANQVTVIGETTVSGLHLVLSDQDAQPLYNVTDDATTALEPPPGARYFLVDVTDHVVNYEDKLPGADVVLTFARGDETFDVPLAPVISPAYGFHYGANAVVEPGTWEVTVTVTGLDFLLHAGAAVNLPRRPVTASFSYTAG